MIWSLVWRSIVITSAMFDWNDEELSNIIWGESGESDDHIVPYPASEEKPPSLYEDGIKREVNQESADFKIADVNKSIAKTNFHGCKIENSSQYHKSSHTRLINSSWPELSLSNAAKPDQDSIGAQVSNDLTKIAKYDSTRGDELSKLENHSEVQQNQHEDREQGEFVDYRWANIGSFDDLERIFSNDDQLFGQVSLGNVDELWSSSKDANSTAEKCFSSMSMNSPDLRSSALSDTSEQFEIKTNYVLGTDQPFTAVYEKTGKTSSQSEQDVSASMNQAGLEMENFTAFHSHHDAIGTSNEFVDEKKLFRRSRKKMEEKSEARQSQDLYSSLSPSQHQFQQFDSRFTSSMGQSCASPVLSQQRQLQGPASPRFQYFSNPLSATYVYGNVANQYPGMPLLQHTHAGVDSHTPVGPGFQVSPGNTNPSNRSEDDSPRPLTMTPQEKIEKLRRRQQMRAMLAIQKQQQQLSQQVSYTNNPIVHNFPNEDQTQLMEGGKTVVEENLQSLLTFDPNSPIEQDDSYTISMPDTSSFEDTILQRLRDIIAKLDVGIRLSIKDSLLRLAQSAKQRHKACDSSSANTSSREELEGYKREEVNSQSRIPDVETETNPIDRTVAYLLFHRPIDSSGKYLETPESPIASKISLGRKPNRFPDRFLPGSSKNMQLSSHQREKDTCLFAEGDQSRSSRCIDSSENASTSGPADGATLDGEASH